MRQAGTIPIKQDAERFASYLLTLGIGSKVEPSDGVWSIWVRDENQVDRSKAELDKFVAQPNDARYQAAEQEAKIARREMAQKTRQAQKNYVDMRNQFANPWRGRRVTLFLIVASVLISLVTDLGDSGVVSDLLISAHQPQRISIQSDLSEIAGGQIWRLVTPIFVHFTLMHLLFNMMWLYDLGSLVENRLRAVRFTLLVLVIAVISNIAQFVAGGPMFGGMSGVVYGLLSYAWVRGRFDPASGLYIHPNTMMFMIGWFVICLLNLIPGLHVANTAHGAGLAVGAVLGCLPQIGKLLRQKA